MQNFHDRERQVFANRMAREQSDRAAAASRRSADMAAENARQSAQRAEQVRQQQQIRQSNERQRQADQRAAKLEKEQRRRRNDNTQYPNVMPGSNSSSSSPLPIGLLGGGASSSRGTTRVYPPSWPVRKSSVAGALLAIVIIFAYCVEKGSKNAPPPANEPSAVQIEQPTPPADSNNPTPSNAPTPAADASK